MKPSRRAVVLGLALALVSAGCSRFAPKAGVGVNAVGVDLAFGIDVESLMSKPPTLLPSFTPPASTPTGLISSSTVPPPPPPPDLPDCLPSQTNTYRDGGAPSTIKDQEFKPNGVLGEGSRPRAGNYFTYYEYNYANEEAHNGFSYKTIKEVNDLDTVEGFSFDVREPENGFAHGMDIGFAIVPQEGDGTNDRAGIYIQELRIPYKEQDYPREPIDKRFFTGVEPGVRLVDFPIQNGNELTDAGPVPEDPDTSSDVPSFGGAAATLTVTSVVGRQDQVFVCDQRAEAWRVSVTMELTGDVDIRIVGNFWLAPQYGGWPIQEAFTMDGGTEFRSGNFFSRIGRLDPGEVV